MSALEDLLLDDLRDSGVYDLAASVGMVQNGRLQEAGGPADTGGDMPSGGLALQRQRSAQAPLAPAPAPSFRVEPAQLATANAVVEQCLDAADAAAVALRLAGLQLEQWASNDADSSAAQANGAAGPGGDGQLSPVDGAGVGDTLPEDDDVPAVASKRKRSGRSSAAGGGAAGGGAAGGAGGSGRSSAGIADDGGKGARGGLRHFSLKVCEKVESKGATSYEEVANELIADLAAEVAAGSVEQQLDEKNIRRRVYDALNVLEAIGMISKNKKAIQWQGWPSGLGRSTEERLRAERSRAVERLETKRQALQDAVHKAYCLCNLAVRNRDMPLPALVHMQDMGVPAPNALKLPFMLVKADEHAEVEVTISDDHLTAHLDFQHWPFVLFDDDRVMRMMGLHRHQPELVAALHSQQAELERQQAQQAAGQQEQQARPQQQQQHATQQLVQAQQQSLEQQVLSGAPPSLRQHQRHAGTACTAEAAAQPTPGKAGAHGRLPTPALQLSPAAGPSDGAPVDAASGAAAMELGSPPASGRLSTGALFHQQPPAPVPQRTHQPPQPQSPVLLVPAAHAGNHAVPVKAEPHIHGVGHVAAPAFGFPAAPQATAAFLPPQAGAHAQAGWPVRRADQGRGNPAAMPVHTQAPQLRPAHGWAQQQQQQQQPQLQPQ